MLGFTESFPKPKPEFPTSPGLPQASYPDVTNQFNAAKNNMYQGITKTQASQGTSGVNSMFQQNFQPGGAWDLKSKPDFPGTDNQGQTQYAQFQGGRITGDFLNHHMLGLGIAASGQHPDFGLLDGEPQVGSPYSAQQLPDGMNHPQAIASGYKSYLGDNSWQNQAMNNVPQSTSLGLSDNEPSSPTGDDSGSDDPSDDGGIVLKGEVSNGGGLPTPPEPNPQPVPEPDPDPTPDPDPNPFPWGFAKEDQTTQRIPQVQSYTPQISSPSSSQGYSDPMAGLLRHQMRFDAMNQTSFHPFQLPQPTLPSTSSVSVKYGGVMVHPQHAQEMAQVSHVYTQTGQQPLQPEEISNWPVNRQTHVGLASQLQYHMTMRAWHPSPQQIQARNFQIGSRGGFDNHPSNADYHANTGYETNLAFNRVLPIVLKQEGGYSNRTNDLGGSTMKGVSQPSYNAYRKHHNLPFKDVRHLTEHEMKAYYYDEFWQIVHADSFTPAWQLALFDTAVNMGPNKADHIYKESKGDLKKFFELREAHYKNLIRKNPKQIEFLRGWMNRNRDIFNKAKEWKNSNH